MEKFNKKSFKFISFYDKINQNSKAKKKEIIYIHIISFIFKPYFPTQ